MSAEAARGDFTLRGSIVVSALLHLLAAGAFLMARGGPPVPMPPTYRVRLIAAPPGPRQVGEVQPVPTAEPPPAPSTPAAVARATPDPSRMKALNEKTPKKAPKISTPHAAPVTKAPAKAAPAPVAGGGPTGGRGADVANVTVDGIDFRYPAYLENVVRQIAIRFNPPGGRALTAVVAFLIRRDGSVTGIRLTTRSGVYSFDTEAMGAVDAAAGAHAFGPLPQGFADDVLPVIFSFDPRLIR
ncbi:MAG: TonB C-terminal domain-containing protein [Gemmatimonadales bacterium]